MLSRIFWTVKRLLLLSHLRLVLEMETENHRIDDKNGKCTQRLKWNLFYPDSSCNVSSRARDTDERNEEKGTNDATKSTNRDWIASKNKELRMLRRFESLKN